LAGKKVARKIDSDGNPCFYGGLTRLAGGGLMAKWKWLVGVLAVSLLMGCTASLSPADRSAIDQALEAGRTATQAAQRAEQAAERAQQAAQRAAESARLAESSAQGAAASAKQAEAAAQSAAVAGEQAQQSATQATRAFELGRRK
jgi:regulator of protease activity HflC (stomatin/prohibitin superfamily)